MYELVTTWYQPDPLPCFADLLQVVVLCVGTGLLPVAECRMLRKRFDVLVSCSAPDDQSLGLSRSKLLCEYLP